LDRWLEGKLREGFADRILPVDVAAANEWGRLLAGSEKAGTALGGIAALIAATAIVHDLQVVTRNVGHFRPAGVDVICPWQE